ncbi:MAG: methyltransferase domain-containing protein [Moraxellaceae bacterium]|nr:methyltransferase domain-containing protein [Moraxellaceae bacterium]
MIKRLFRRVAGKAFSRPTPSVGTKNASTREQWLETTLSGLPAGWRLLDAGAGECQFRKFCQHLQYVSQDFSQYTGAGDNAGLQTGVWDTSRIDIVCDISDIPEPDQSFDAILCTEVLEHLPEPVLALKEFSRLLRPGGRLILTAPFSSLTHFSPYHFATGFNRYFYLHHLPRLGFSDVVIEENGNFFEFVAQELHRVNECATRYAGQRLNGREERAVNVLLAALDRFSASDTGSKELLNFDLQVTAIRQPDPLSGAHVQDR